MRRLGDIVRPSNKSLKENAGGRRSYLNRSILRLNLDQRIASGHGLAKSFEPPADVRLGFGFSNLGRAYFHQHERYFPIIFTKL